MKKLKQTKTKQEKPSDIIYQYANEYDAERNNDGMFSTDSALIWGIIQYLDKIKEPTQ